MSLDHSELRYLQQLVSVFQGKHSVITRHDPHLPNLLQELLRILQAGVYEGSHFIDFVEQCLGHREETPHETLLLVRERTDLRGEDPTKLYIILSLCSREQLWYVIDRCCTMKDVLQAYYDTNALLCDDLFVISFVAVLRALARVSFVNLDICAMPAFEAECAVMAVGLPVVSQRSPLSTPITTTTNSNTFSTPLMMSLSLPGGGGAADTTVVEGDPTSPGPVVAVRQPSSVKTVRVIQRIVMNKETQQQQQQQNAAAHPKPDTVEVGINAVPPAVSYTDAGIQTLVFQDPRELEYRRLDIELAARESALSRRETALELQHQHVVESQQEADLHVATLRSTVRSLKVLYDDLFHLGRTNPSANVDETLLPEVIPKLIEFLCEQGVVERVERPEGSSGDVTTSATNRRRSQRVDDVPVITYEPPEVSLSNQLVAQSYLCATTGCGQELKNTTTSWDLLGFSVAYPRRCAYSGQLYCGKCHTKKSAILPSRVLHKWDFAPQRVCDKVYDYLLSSAMVPLYDIGVIQPSLFLKVPKLQAVWSLRGQLAVIGEIVARCKDIRANSAVDLTLHFFEESERYSMSELERTNKGVLLDELKGYRDECVRHILQQCAACRSRTVRQCPLCSGEDQIFIFDTKNVVRCVHCKEAYHATCFEVMGCRTCKAAVIE